MIVTMDRPPVNAIDTAFSTGLYSVFRDFNENDELKAAILIGADNPKCIFSAGWGSQGRGTRRGPGRGKGFRPRPRGNRRSRSFSTL
ncbi:enoyl-CoA hydratase-related protein [Mesorhizobium sp. M0482]|uniref:enoyl-CoA hydratase-related protein n=1 Tax=Mesorhizobium sp. M0482 TaxID=2956948 RepID=UPI00333874E1